MAFMKEEEQEGQLTETLQRTEEMRLACNKPLQLLSSSFLLYDAPLMSVEDCTEATSKLQSNVELQ